MENVDMPIEIALVGRGWMVGKWFCRRRLMYRAALIATAHSMDLICT